MRQLAYSPLRTLFILLLAGFTTFTQANDQLFSSFGEHKVYHSVFNSSFIQPDIARSYSLTRGKDRVLINIAVVKSNPEGDSKGLAATVTGSATNLMQQQKILEFIEISEGDATYYLAPLRISNEEILNFSIQVSINGSTHEIDFTKKLYVD